MARLKGIKTLDLSGLTVSQKDKGRIGISFDTASLRDQLSEDMGSFTIGSDANALITLSGKIKINGNIIQGVDGNENIKLFTSGKTQIVGELNLLVNTLTMGAPDSASTIQHEDQDTNDTAGQNIIIKASAGKGNGTGGNIIFQTAKAPGGASSSTQGVHASALTLDQDGDATVANDCVVGGDLTVSGNNINYSAGHSFLSVGARSGTNVGGYRLGLEAGQGTGTGVGGTINLRTSLAGSSGSSSNSLSTIMGIHGTGDIGIRATSKLGFGSELGTSDTYIQESSADVLDIYAGGDNALKIDENTGYIDVHEDWTLRAGAPSNGSLRLKILPSDFVASDGGRPVMMDDTGSDRWMESHGTLPFFVSKEIPRGYKATVVTIYGSGTSAVTVYEAVYTGKSVTSKGTGNIGTSIDITDVNSTDSNYILIEMAQASGEEVYGGHIDIALIT